ncbi:HEAT repeat domain-containing protein [Paractinoplanes lichenicola]|uniref:HEAT repeat domain-containing protein n=1 Tax=Paractinoplanes lichenicola TaxID=2802976 RepID=A0ABS1VQG7_9ACTN|nr:HEAT repeat domain-containing protein [Actinoplanes lichenicola]MBL7256973.1 HEAT repeat domain-containing protein [Actinoplanes lichenicola]
MRDVMLRLADDWEAAKAELVTLGGAAVGPLIAELADEESPVQWSSIGVVLREIGRPAFAPLAEALAAAPTPEVKRRYGWAFMGFGVALLDDYIGALAHPSARVREDAALGIQYCRERAAPAVPALAGLLDDPDAEVRQRVIWALGEIGAAAIPALQQVRREGPGRRRAAALRALAGIGGFEAFSAADRAAVERLVRVKLIDERIEGEEPHGRWLALPTGDQAAVLEALGLSSPRPATMRLGRAVAGAASHGSVPEEWRRAVVFVSPQLDDWTLVFGHWADDDREHDAIRSLSARFGRAQAYWYDDQTGSSGWTIAGGGVVIRHYSDAGDACSGERLPIEREKPTFADLEELPADQWPDDDNDVCDGLAVAAAMSISPSELGPETLVRGTGVLALTEAGRDLGGCPAGAFPI